MFLLLTLLKMSQNLQKRKEISRDIRKLIVKLRNDGNSYGEIAKIVQISRAIVQTIIKNYHSTNTTENKHRSGTPSKLSDREKRNIIRIVTDEPRTNAVNIAKDLEKSKQMSIHPETIRNVLRANEFHSRIPRKKPFISEANMKKRLEFAKLHKSDDMSFWKNVIFSDESKYNIFGYDGKQRVWRKPNTAMAIQNLLPTVKHGGASVMVWGCISAAGVGNLVFIENNMDRYVYLNILKTNLKTSVAKMGLSGKWIFQQDNDPKHTSLIVKEWLLQNVPQQLHSPPQSPDLNPIENIWDELDRRIRKNKITCKKDLKKALVEEWDKIGSDETTNLISSMPKRIQAVLDANGGPTKY